jgi:cell division protein FtsL
MKDRRVQIVVAFSFVLLCFFFLLYVRSRVVRERYHLGEKLREYQSLQQKNYVLKKRRDELVKPERLREIARKMGFHPPQAEEIMR